MISFIVPAHDEDAWIGRCLSATQTAMNAVDAPHEVIVVDDVSSDRTGAIAREHGARVIQVAHWQISATRNSGARDSHGDVLFFVDADTLVSVAVMEEALKAINEGAVGGGCIPRFDGRRPPWFRAVYPLMVIAMRWVLRQTGGACLFCTRQGFEFTGGFSEAHFAAEEAVWVKALKRHGRFVALAAPVITSGRNLRTQSFWTIARIFLRLVFRGPDGFRDRRGLDLWYRPSRDDAEP